jgi:hypothetical protein
MAYENYNFVSWSDGTPITSLRLSQMSTNIEQVKDVIDDKATGVLKFNQLTTQSPNATGYSDFTEHEVIYLKDESGTGGSDTRVSIAENRYYKITVNIPAISVLSAGAEDSRYVINLYNGSNIADAGKQKLGYWEITPHTFTFANVAMGLPANIANEAIKSNTYPSKIGSGTYTVLQTTGSSLTNQSFFLSVSRVAGANIVNAPNWRIEGNSSAPIQIYVEDAGGI